MVVFVGAAAAAAPPPCSCAYSPSSTCSSTPPFPFRFRFRLSVGALPPSPSSASSSSSNANAAAAAAERTRQLALLDQHLRRGDEQAALSLARALQGSHGDGGLRCFGAARQLPQRLYTLDELKLNGIDAASFLAPRDLTLASLRTTLQLALASAALSAALAFRPSQLQLLSLALLLLFLSSLDLIYFGGGLSSLLLDTIAHAVSPKYHTRVLQHEAGHFLVAYLLGVLPKSYTITSLHTLTQQRSLNVQAGTAFVDFDFLQEVQSGKLSSKTLDRFSCIALAGVATEYLLYGYSEGGLDDIAKLDGLLKSLGFTQKKADSQVRWAVLNTILILRRHEKARLQLAEAMSSGKSVGSCIDVIESNIDFEDI